MCIRDSAYCLGFPAEKSVLSVLEQYRNNLYVEYAEPNGIIYAYDIIPNDPYFGSQWGLKKIAVSEAWGIEKGENDIVVAILDTGIDYDHEDLAGHIWINQGEYGLPKSTNSIDDDGNGKKDDWQGWDFIGTGYFDNNGNAIDPVPDNDPMDDHGHGTHVAGIVGALTDNGIGVAGVCWNVKLMMVRVLDASGAGNAGYLASGIDYAKEMGAHIINMSLGGVENSTLKLAVSSALNNGCLLVAATGNSNSNVIPFPAAYDSYVLAVGAVDENDNRAIWPGSGGSNYGPEIDVAAPGSSIYLSLIHI